jgi:hypothetical protein
MPWIRAGSTNPTPAATTYARPRTSGRSRLHRDRSLFTGPEGGTDAATEDDNGCDGDSRFGVMCLTHVAGGSQTCRLAHMNPYASTYTPGFTS